MLKKLLLSLIVVALVSMTGFAQNKTASSLKKVIPNENYVAPALKGGQPSAPAAYSVKNPVVGDTIATSSYDIFTNSIVRDQIALYNGAVGFAPMLRKTNTNNRRVVTYIKVDAGTYATKAAFDTTSNSGWGTLDYALSGDAMGFAAVVAHHVVGGATKTRLSLYDPSVSDFTTYSFGADGTDPSVQFAGNNILLANSGNRTLFQFFKTTDFGSSFVNFDSIKTFHPKPIYWKENGGVEVGMAKSLNEKYYLYFGTNVGEGHIIDGIHPDSADNIWVVRSTDAGSTWTGKTIGHDGEFGTAVSSKANFAPLFENFGQSDFAVDTLGNYYGLANGYGYGIVGTDTLVTAPVLFYSSKTAKWIPISDIAVDTVEFLTTTGRYPGNGIGQSFPSIAASPDGKVLFAMWTAPQWSAGKIDTNEIGVSMTDQYYATSMDWGATWTKPAIFAGKKNVAEIYGHAAQFLQKSGNDWVAHTLYLEDLITGGSVFGGAGGAASDNPIVYKTMVVLGVGNDKDASVANSFALDQNYPNPFNPSTSISFTLNSKETVALRVYDVMGREVATLVNGSMEKGQHTVSFDASTLASGVYVYRLEAGNFVSAKKMVLMK